MMKVSFGKALSGVLAATMLLTGFGACGKSSSTPGVDTSSSGKQETTVSTADAQKEEAASLVLWGSEDDQVMLKEMAEAFVGEHPTYTVEVRVQGEDKAREAALKDLEAAADVFAIAHDQMGALVDAGAVYPNTLYADQLKGTVSDAAIAAATYKGTVYGYPSAVETYFMFYNKGVFTEEDVKSFDKMLEVAKNAGKTVGTDFGNNYFNMCFWFANGVKLFGSDGTDPNGSTVNGAEALAAAEYIAGLQDRGAQDITDGDASAAFQNGTLAAMITGAWKAQDYQAALGDNYGVVKLPTANIGGSEKQLVSFSGVKVYVVKSNTKYPEASMQLAAFLTNEENQLKRFKDRGFLPSNLTAAADPSVTEDPTIAAQVAQFSFSIPQPSIPQMGSNFYSPSSMAVTKEIFNHTQTDLQAALDNWAGMLKSEIVE